MRYTQFTCGLSRTVNLGNYESCRFELSVVVDLSDEEDAEGAGGIDVAMEHGADRFRGLVREAYQDVARELAIERQRRLKSPENVVSIEERLGGAVLRPGKAVPAWTATTATSTAGGVSPVMD